MSPNKFRNEITIHLRSKLKSYWLSLRRRSCPKCIRTCSACCGSPHCRASPPTPPPTHPTCSDSAGGRESRLSLMYYIAWKLPESLKVFQAIYHFIQVNCSEIFTPVITDTGVCCAFNLHMKFVDSEYSQLVKEMQVKTFSSTNILWMKKFPEYFWSGFRFQSVEGSLSR